MASQKYLGIDLSTQSLTALVIDPEDYSIDKHQIVFDSDLPQYGTSGGVPPSPEPTQALVDPLMWVEALEQALSWLEQSGLAESVTGVSVSAQQHGTVYLNSNAPEALRGLDPKLPLHDQLSGIFSRTRSPIWMDSSTSRECMEITQALSDGPGIMQLTGSHATERFAAPQIRKFWKHEPEAYVNTAHIALISSFITSLLTGELAPIDGGDGLGMNLVDIATGDWSAPALEATAPGLEGKLPPVLKRDEIVGKASSFLVQRYGFKPDCKVVVGTGDNPASLVGLGLVGEEKVRAISLGTSDTYFGYISSLLEQRREEGHIFGAADGGLMFLLCYKNGSQTREAIRDEFGLSWNDFANILLSSPSGNQGRIMLPYLMPEITPLALEPGIHRYGGLDALDAAANVRAVVEAQVMSMYLHSNWAGPRPNEILITAGGSENKGILKVIASVFGAKVRSFEVTDSAALGAAIRAAVCHLNADGHEVDTATLSRTFSSSAASELVSVSREETGIYQGEHGLLTVYAACEAHYLRQGPDPAKAIQRFKRKYC
jgi:xylulokinase